MAPHLSLARQAGLIGEATDRPTPLGVGIVEELIGRTSARRIVDDPGAAPWPNPAASRQHWRNLTALSGKARGELLLRLFGRSAELEAAKGATAHGPAGAGGTPGSVARSVLGLRRGRAAAIRAAT